MKLALISNGGDAFRDWSLALTLGGHNVLMEPQLAFPTDDQVWPIDKETVERLDLLQLSRIVDAEAVLVLNRHAVFTPAMQMEVKWARLLGKRLFWLETSDQGKYLGATAFQIHSAFTGEPIMVDQASLLEKYR